MSHLIKLRAWDGTQYHGPFTPNDIASELTSLNSAPCMSDDLVFELWTGLVDRTGREIYEGDIVTLPLHPHKAGVVEYRISDWGCEYTVRSSRKNNVIDEIHYHGLRPEDRIPLPENRREVIGNVHENPELLPSRS